MWLREHCTCPRKQACAGGMYLWMYGSSSSSESTFATAVARHVCDTCFLSAPFLCVGKCWNSAGLYTDVDTTYCAGVCSNAAERGAGGLARLLRFFCSAFNLVGLFATSVCSLLSSPELLVQLSACIVGCNADVASRTVSFIPGACWPAQLLLSADV